MKSIAVFIYGYKSKFLINTVKTLFENISNSNLINVYVYDQHHLERKEHFDKLLYKHIFWDHIKNPNEYRNSILSLCKEEYFLQLGDGVILNKNWDEDLINISNELNSVISGNNTIQLKVDGYKIKKTKTPSNQIKQVGLVDRNFIFAKTSVLKTISFSNTFKYNGDEEDFSCKAFNNNIKIYCLPYTFYTDKTQDLNEHPYVPFSLDHGYDNLKNIISNSPKFLEFNNLNVNNMSFPSYINNDVAYDMLRSPYNSVGGEKFYTTVKEIR